MPGLPRLLPQRRPPLAAGVAVALTAVAVTTLLIYPLKEQAPVLSLGVLYVLAVLGVSVVWGLRLGIAAGLLSAAAFNYFHIPPTGGFSIGRTEDWVALSVFVVAALLAGSVGELARARAQEAEQRRLEADLAAEMARLLLRGGRLQDTLPVVASRLASALSLRSAAIELTALSSDEHRVAFPLRERGAQTGTLVVAAATPEAVLRRLQERVVPSLEALLAAALERDALQEDAVQTIALRRSDGIKTALLRSVSHDLRSPLTAILTSAAALQAGSLSDTERHELALAVGEEATRLSRLIDNLLDLSRLEAHAAEPQRAWCSVEEVIGAAVDGLGLPAGTFHTPLDADLPPVRADAAQLERAFANLLENAARHSGGHPVSVRARDVGGRVIVRVVDRGPGIPPAQRERIFEPFYRAGTADTGHRGSGLGLAIARGFVEANGGRIWVESLPGQATTFVVELPLDPAESSPEGSDPEGAARLKAHDSRAPTP